jgi:hypothetical protein
MRQQTLIFPNFQRAFKIENTLEEGRNQKEGEETKRGTAVSK